MYEKLSKAFIMPNEIFRLGLNPGEIATYAYLLSTENRKTYQCWPSYETIGQAIGKSKNSVKKYVEGLVKRGLIETEPTQIFTQAGLKRNGSLRYTILPIRNAVNLSHEKQMETLELSAERQWVQEKFEHFATETALRVNFPDGPSGAREASVCDTSSMTGQ